MIFPEPVGDATSRGPPISRTDSNEHQADGHAQPTDQDRHNHAFTGLVPSSFQSANPLAARRKPASISEIFEKRTGLLPEEWTRQYPRLAKQ